MLSGMSDAHLSSLETKPVKGRGAVSNRSGRYETETRELADDGWESLAEDLEARPRTELRWDASKSVIARNQSPDVPFDQSINPYRGCEHGCVYCFARPSHAYLGLSPGLDFETKLYAKPKVAELLRHELAKPGYKAKVIALGTNTDPYQPLERRLTLTRQILEVLAEFNHPVTIVTKSDLVVRDADILGEMAAKGLARVALSVTSLNANLSRRMEPRAPRPDKRLAAIAALSEAGIPTAVMTAPLIPALNDHEMEAILEAAQKVGARTAGYVLLRLPLEIAGLFEEWLDAHAPDRKARVMKLVRETRGGKDYESDWGLRLTGRGPYADLIQRRFDLARRKLGLDKGAWALDTTQFLKPEKPSNQLSLF